MNPIVAIDGPAGSGKSTLARRLATELNLPYVNTGLMYRAVALEAHRRGIEVDDAASLASLAGSIRFDLDPSVRPPTLRIQGREPADDLVSPEVESRVSRVARHPEVRAVLRDRQRRLIQGGAVVEGRDIGSVVAPDAEVKLFLQADVDERISRRSAERGAAVEPVGESLVHRDLADARTSPFVPAADAVELDTTGMDAETVYGTALAIVRVKLAEREGRAR